MKLKRICTALFVALSLLFAQQGMAAHMLGHAFEQLRQKHSTPAQVDSCDQCAAYAQIGNALNTCTFELKAVAPARCAAQPLCSAFAPLTVHSATARGPPAFPLVD